MSQDTKLRQEMQDILGHLRTMRDEVRVRLHLAGMEAKDTWRDIDAELDRAEVLAENATEGSKRALRRLAKGVQAFKDTLRDEPKPGEHDDEKSPRGCCE